jgi:hypothetical protein
MTDAPGRTFDSQLKQRCFVAAWTLALALRVLFGWEVHASLGGFLAFEELFVELALITAPFVAWLFLRADGAFERPGLLTGVWVGGALLCYFQLGTFSTSARAYLWRSEASLLREAAAIRLGHEPPKPTFGLHIRSEPGRVYWPCSGFALSSHGLVYDPSGRIRVDEHAFGGSLIRVERLRGPWYVCWFT